MSLFFSIIIIVVFSMVAAILSASETAITMASKPHLTQLAKKNNRKAGLLLNLQNNMNTLISTIVLMNTCLFAGITALAAQMMSNILGEWGVFFASLFMGAFITFYLEVLPKVYAYQSPEKVGLFLVPLIGVFKKFLHPITSFMDWVAHKTLALCGVAPPEAKESLEELRGAIDMHMGDDAFHERAMLRSILDLSQVTVEEIMVHRKNIISYSIDTPNEILREKILCAGYTRIPLWKDSPDNIVGVINIKNVARALSTQRENDPLDFKSVMSEPWFIPDTSTLFTQLQLFREKSKHQAFVVDEYGSLLGMITLEDILEEIVGEITDEHDIALAGVRLDGKGAFIIQGSVTLRDLQRQYDWDFGDSPASTLAGLVLHHLRTIPEVGDAVKIGPFHMQILRRHHHQITLLKVTPPTQLVA